MNIYHHDRFAEPTQPAPRIETKHRRIQTPIPAPQTRDVLEANRRLFPRVNCYQPPIIWERAEDYQVFDAADNCWIDFSSTAVMTNAGHAHPAIRQALETQAREGMLAQFSFPSEQRVRLAERILNICPPGMEKVYFWTTGSEAIESALRLVRTWGQQRDPKKTHVLTHRGDFHGITLGATQLSGAAASKDWLVSPDQHIHHLPFPGPPDYPDLADPVTLLETGLAQLEEHGIAGSQIAGVFLETMQGWGALSYPVAYLKRLRQWADQHQVLLVFDEIQTGFGRTGRWFGHQHYGVRPDLLCVGKGLSSSLPLAAVIGPASVLDVLSPGAVTTTHAAHPVSCAAALANLEVLEQQNLIDEADRKGQLVGQDLARLQRRFPDQIARVEGRGLLWALHLCNPSTGEADDRLAADWTWSAVRHGVMVFHTMRPTLKICPPLTIPDSALHEGIETLATALQSLVAQSP
ncbi:MAG: hypothetical protein CMJ70_08220 [Planctomycetaceae bacterium]|nr:hypothetical protein [Planctomycetaceae bacterium]|tara:strand:- start:158 stop:1549 length:1392 start_codon:yes stop_codon:yes gene_type:complete